MSSEQGAVVEDCGNPDEPVLSEQTAWELRSIAPCRPQLVIGAWSLVIAHSIIRYFVIRYPTQPCFTPA